MRNYWIGVWARKGTRREIREFLDNPVEMNDSQIDFCIETVSEQFYKHRTSPYQLAIEGCKLLANVMLQRIRLRFAKDESLLDNAESAYKDWQERVKQP